MNGLKTRLESIEGVEGIVIELGEEELKGITVRLAEGADELRVLEAVRRLLVAYGTRSICDLVTAGTPEPVTPGPEAVHEYERSDVEHRILDIDSVPSEMVSEPEVRPVSSGKEEAEMLLTPHDRIQLSVTPAGDRSTAQVVCTGGERTLTRQVPSSARAIVQAVLDMAAEMVGREPITVIGLNLSEIEKVRVLTVIAGNEGETPRVSTVSVVDAHWPAALLQVANQILEDRLQ